MHRLEAVDFLLASALFLGDRHGPWVCTNASLTVAGVLLTVFEPSLFEGDPFKITKGHIYLFVGGWLYTMSLLITKKYLVYVNIGILALFKVRLGIYYRPYSISFIIIITTTTTTTSLSLSRLLLLPLLTLPHHHDRSQ